MTKLLILLVYLMPYVGISQIQQPTNIYFTAKELRGNANPKTIVLIDRNVGSISGLPIISVSVNIDGYFFYSFETPLPMINGTPPKQPEVIIWAEDIDGKTSSKITITAISESTALKDIVDGTIVLPNKTISTNPEIDGLQLPSTTFRYKIKMLNTNFTIPLARFNFVKDNSNSKKGEILLFNSVGAGIGVSWGEMEKTTDANGATLNTDFTNTFGIHLGVLFSSGQDGNEQKNVFAPTLSISILDFQLGAGYELGTTLESQKKGFVTLAYAIPLSKLIKGKYYIFTASKGYNSLNPLPELISDGGKTKSSKNTYIQ